MDNEPYRDLTHIQLIATVSDWIRSQGCQVTNEHQLPNGKVADVIYLTPAGSISIVECKVILTTTLIDQAYDKYFQWCNRLWVATNRVTRFDQRGDDRSLDFAEGPFKTGLLVVSQDNVRVERTARFHTLDHETEHRVRAGLPPLRHDDHGGTPHDD